MKILYKNKIQYLMHFPGNSSKVQEYVFKLVKDNKIKKSDKLSIVLCANKKCLDNSNILYQLNLNNISFYNSDEAYNATNWNNTLKCKWILQSLKQVNTEYSLICDVRDVIITNNLDESLLSKIDHDIIFNASRYKFPDISFENEWYNHLETKYPYFNAGLCIGKTEKLIELYSELEKIHFDDYSEQANFRKLLSNKIFDIYVDSNREIFSANHEQDCYIRKKNKDNLELIDDIKAFKNCKLFTKLFKSSNVIVLKDLSDKSINTYINLEKSENHFILYETNDYRDLDKIKEFNFSNKFIILTESLMSIEINMIIKKNGKLWCPYLKSILTNNSIYVKNDIDYPPTLQLADIDYKTYCKTTIISLGKIVKCNNCNGSNCIYVSV